MGNDAERIVRALQDADVAGAEYFGRFVNDTRYLTASPFDEQAAIPTLLDLLPSISDSRDLEAAVRYLGRASARPAAFEPLHQVFLSRAAQDQSLGRSVGDSIATTATLSNIDSLLEIATDRKFGTARQMIVYSLWRFKKDGRVKDALLDLIHDPDVSRHAMSALRRTVGNEDAIKHFKVVRDTSNIQTVRKQAQQAISKSESAMAKSGQHRGHHGLASRNS